MLAARLLLLILLFASLAGCAAADRKVTMLYRPAVDASGGSGELYLSSSAGGTGIDENAPVQWIVGSVRETSGEKTGEIVSRIPPQQLVLDALRQELIRSGYQVTEVEVQPAGVAKGIDIAAITVGLEEVGSLARSEGSARVAISIAVWKGGREVRKLGYDARFSDFAITERSQLAANVLQNALQGVMEQAVPEIISTLER